MTSDERHRAGRAVAARIRELDTTSARVAEAAGIDRSTLSALIHGHRWPHRDTRARICRVLRWPEGEIVRRGMSINTLAEYSIDELLAEVRRRCRFTSEEEAG